MRKIFGGLAALALMAGIFTSAPAKAVDPAWNTTGSYQVQFSCDVGCPTGPYGHDMTLAQSGGGTLTGNGGSPIGANSRQSGDRRRLR